ncbi:amino acid adenylation domain-containing protein [Micromonospora sp. DT178]|uniref:amino acid adenylation domain-containing protein n=1 Tax=Micromonospora sp. DT178 TaxID=3393436 RepID=UPI003CFBBF8A
MGSKSIQEQFARQVAQTPDAPAVSGGRVRLTYRQLDERANRLAHQLISLGVRPGEPVAVLITRSPELVVATLGVLKAGAVYMPLHNAHPLEAKQRFMDNAGRPVLLTDEEARRAGLPASKRTVLVDSASAQQERSVVGPNIDARSEDLACIIHTSGSEGLPRGVCVTHRGVLSVALDSCWDTSSQDRVLMVAPYAAAVSTYELWVPLLRGGHLVLAPPGRLDLGTLRRLIRDNEITAVQLTSGLFRVLADKAPDCLATVGEVSTGGDVISPSAVERVLKACPDITVRPTYGASEVTLFATTTTVTAPFVPSTRVPVGRPMDNVELYVLDERLRPVGTGQVGELYIAGERLARGYLGRPGLTAERFVANRFSGPGRRMYRSGDLVRWTTDNMIEFVGRANDQVKIRGFRVGIAEVEAALTTYPEISEAIVVARQDEDGHHSLVGYVVGGTDAVDITALRKHAEKVLPDYMIPAAFVVLDSLPLTPNGKVDRRALPEPVLAGSSTYQPPSTAQQETLCSAFANALGVAEVGVNDSFFELGGQSLSGIRLIQTVNEALSVELTLDHLFEFPTVTELDQYLLEQAEPIDRSQDEPN